MPLAFHLGRIVSIFSKIELAVLKVRIQQSHHKDVRDTHPRTFLKKTFIGMQLLYSAVLVSADTAASQPHVHTYPFFGFPSRGGLRRALGRAPYALQSVLTALLFCTQQSTWQSQSPSLNPLLPLVSVHSLFFSTSLPLCLIYK